jgi:hypothetical protein
MLFAMGTVSLIDSRQATAKRTRGETGRPRTIEDTKKQILQLANDNVWGYTWILGEFWILGIESLTRDTVISSPRRLSRRPVCGMKLPCKILIQDQGVPIGTNRSADAWFGEVVPERKFH